MVPKPGYDINEIFYSIQGEGHWTGRPAIFVRFAGCNLHCEWCDTDFSLQYELELDKLLLKIKHTAQCTNVILTGGEPTLQDLGPLVEGLRKARFWVAIETNGICWERIPKEIDWVTMSPKELGKVYICDELKLIYTGEEDLAKYHAVGRQAWLHGEQVQALHFLQPCERDGVMNIEETVQKVKENPTWHLSLQTHKLIGLQ